MKKVSVIIINRNRKSDLKECLTSVLNQDYQKKEIIVVDNASSDGSWQMVENDFLDVILT